MKNQNTKTPQVVMPNSEPTLESIEITSEQIEANINRLLAEEIAAPNSATANLNFDATAYAELTSVQRPETVDPTIGEADPYVNLEEPPIQSETNQPESIDSSGPTNAAPGESPYPSPSSKVDEILSRLPDYCPELDAATETEAEQTSPITIEASRTTEPTSDQPLVEVIDPAAEATEPETESAETSVDEFSPSVTEFADFTSQLKTTDCVDIQTEPAPAEEPPAAVSPPVPIVNASPETGEPIYDVRDFSESTAGTPEPIPGSYEVAPDAFDFHTAEDLPSQNPANLTTEPEQVFMASEGDIIQIDGNDGYDFIDLACFNVDSATFSNNLIKIDDDQGNKFEIRHQNVSYALFDNGVQVILKANQQ